jgi:hypothetical protein
VSKKVSGFAAKAKKDFMKQDEKADKKLMSKIIKKDMPQGKKK